MHFVTDCSFTSALFLPDENSIHIRDFFLKLKKNDQISIPTLWWNETLNVLNIAVKRKRISYEDCSRIIDSFDHLKFNTDYEHGIEISKRIFDYTQLFGITSYDASYIELAVRKKAKIMSLDKELLTATKKIGLEYFKVI